MDVNETLGVLGDRVDKDFTLPVSDPVFWELILVLFLVSLKFWRVQRSLIFILVLAGVILTIPLWAVALSRVLLSHGIVFDAELMRLLAAVVIAVLFFFYITKWQQDQ